MTPNKLSGATRSEFEKVLEVSIKGKTGCRNERKTLLKPAAKLVTVVKGGWEVLSPLLAFGVLPMDTGGGLSPSGAPKRRLEVEEGTGKRRL